MVYKIKPDGTQEGTVLVTNNDGLVSMTLDWVSNLMFYVDNIRNSLEVVHLDNQKWQRTLKRGLKEPTSIAVHPGKGYWLVMKRTNHFSKQTNCFQVYFLFRSCSSCQDLQVYYGYEHMRCDKKFLSGTASRISYWLCTGPTVLRWFNFGSHRMYELGRNQR